MARRINGVRFPKSAGFERSAGVGEGLVVLILLLIENVSACRMGLPTSLSIVIELFWNAVNC